tara:strand:- start:413 stop:781 length:369 start_codon:yes stop_codon:yes gene_type:complete
MPRTETYDFFFRPEGRKFSKDNVVSVTMVAVAGLTLQEALVAALDARILPKGSHRSGCFQVQTDRGIFQSAKDSRIDLSTPRKAANVFFASWEAMEANELSGGTGCPTECGTALESTGVRWF